MAISERDLILRQVWSLLSELRSTAYTRSDQLIPQVLGMIFLKYLNDQATVTGQSSGTHGDVHWFLPEECDWNRVTAILERAGGAPEYVAHTFDAHPKNHHLSEVLAALGLTERLEEPRIYRLLIYHISNMDMRGFGSEDFGWIVDNLLGRSRRTPRQQSEYTTPQDITSLMVTLLDPHPGSSIYDPACGFGGSLINAYRYVTGNSPDSSQPQLFGQEIVTWVSDLARANMILHGISSAIIVTGDTITQPQMLDDRGQLQRFDYVITNPPFLTRIDSYTREEIWTDPYGRFRYGVQGNIADGLFIQHVIASLSERGRAVMLLPPGVLFSNALKRVRRGLLEEDLLEAVVSLPGSALFGTTVSPVIFVLNRAKAFHLRGWTIVIYAQELHDAETRTINEEQRQQIVEAVREGGEQQGFATLVNLDQFASMNFELTPARYVELIDFGSFLGGEANWCVLTELGEVLPGTRGLGHTKGDTSIVRGRDLSNPTLTEEDLDKISLPDSSRNPVHTQVGDILIQRNRQRPRVLLVDEGLQGILVADTVYVIRLRQEHHHLAGYIVDFLASDFGQEYLTTQFQGLTVPTLRLEDLRELQIPIPRDAAMLALMREISHAEEDLLERLGQIRNLRQQALNLADVDVIRERLSSLNISAQVLAATIEQSEDFDFQMRFYYPLPLAYAYRSLSPILEPSQRYQEQLRVAENILSFLGSIGLALATHTEVTSQEANTNLTADFLRRCWGGGISPGDWRDISIHAARLMRSHQEFAAVESFSSLWFRGTGQRQSEFAEATRAFVELKNDFKHDRGPRTPDEYTQAVVRMEELLHECLESLAFFIRHPIRLVERVDKDWRTGQALVDTLVYRGDHPGVPQEQVKLPVHVPLTHLYLQLTDEHWVSLHPMITVQYCPECRTRETYIIDVCNMGSRPRVVLKSFERGHTLDNDEAARQVGDDLSHYIQLHFEGGT